MKRRRPEAGPMTTDHELGEILRRSMHAAVDSAEPAGDGLQQIRRRLEKPRLQLQLRLWLTESADLVRVIGIRLEPVASRLLADVLAAWKAVLTWVRPPADASGRPAAESRRRQVAAHRSQPPGRLASLLSPTAAWLRPALAVVGVVAVVAAGVFGLFQLRQNVTDISLTNGRGPSPSAPPPTVIPTIQPTWIPGISPPTRFVTPSTHRKATRHHASPAPTCTPSPSSAPASSPSPAAAQPTPSGSPTAIPSPSASPSPSPSATANSAAGGVATPSAMTLSAGASLPRLAASGCHSSATPSTSKPASSPAAAQ